MTVPSITRDERNPGLERAQWKRRALQRGRRRAVRRGAPPKRAETGRHNPFSWDLRQATIESDDEKSQCDVSHRLASGCKRIKLLHPKTRADEIPPIAGECWFLAGPTAAGKTAVGLDLARRLGAEIVSMDSMAVYRGMDIGTAKPTPRQRAVVAHHLIDVVDPWDEFSLADYVRAAHERAARIVARGRPALFVGGTPLYLKALLRGMFEGPPADAPLRRCLLRLARAHGSTRLHAELARVDPDAAARLHPNDTKRLIRALEVYATTGRPISRWQRQFDRPRADAPRHVFVLDWPRPLLAERIDRRVNAMFASGLVDEVARLWLAQRPLGRTARQAVGYREVIEHIEGRLALGDAIEQVKRHTRQMAKRQMTWFRSLAECRMIPCNEPFDARSVAERIAAEGTSVPAGGDAPRS